MKHKEIRLYPTQWMLDVWVCDDLDELAKSFAKVYGASVEHYQDMLSPNQVCWIGKPTGERRIVMNIEEANHAIIAHELIHVIFKLSDLSGIEVNQDSQEWVANLMHYLWEEMETLIK